MGVSVNYRHRTGVLRAQIQLCRHRHLWGYRSRTLTLTIKLTLTLTLFLTLTLYERKQKRHRNICQRRVIFTGYRYLLRDGGGCIRGPEAKNRSFSILDLRSQDVLAADMKLEMCRKLLSTHSTRILSISIETDPTAARPATSWRLIKWCASPSAVAFRLLQISSCSWDAFDRFAGTVSYRDMWMGLMRGRVRTWTSLLVILRAGQCRAARTLQKLPQYISSTAVTRSIVSHQRRHLITRSEPRS